MKRFLVTVFIAALLTTSTDVLACQCGRRPLVAEQYADAPIVFIGKVEAVRDRWNVFAKLRLRVLRFFDPDAMPAVETRSYCTDVGMEVLFTVQQSWKGVSTREVSLLTGRGGGDCGVEFKPGQVYVVYAHGRSGDGCQTNICTRTREVSYASDDLLFLRKRPNQQLR
jgi:hypothetical protein